MKKFFKLFLLSIATLMAVGITEVKADDEVKQNLSISNYTIANEPIPFPDNNGGKINFHVKKTSDGKYVYCMQYAKTPPVATISYNKGSKITDNGLNYILYKGYYASNDQEFFIYQTALWVYMVENNMMEGTHNDIDRFIKYISTNSSDIAKEIRNIVEDAKNVDDWYTIKGVIKVDDSNVSFTLKDGYYVSSKIGVDSSIGKYEYELISAPSGTIVDKNNDHMIIKVPASKVTKTTTISFKVTNNKSVYESYYYTPSNSKYQKMAATFKSKPIVSDTGSVNVTPENNDVITNIIKIDADTNEALSGATLQLANSNGKIISTWTTDGKAREFKNLEADTYTLTEISAPEGYEKSNEKLVFKVDATGKLTDENGKIIDKVVFSNKKIEEKTPTTGVKISKQDITSKKELKGATLIVKDYDGNIVKEWVSGNEATYIELKPGIYTLTEKYAPEGYILSDETITFTVKEDGTIDTVIMYNTPNSKEEVVVENTASFKTMTSAIVGIIISVVGSLLIFKKPKKSV